MCGSARRPARLRLCRFLDPRPSCDAATRPIADAVNIPLTELPARTHELPPRDETVLVAGPADLAQRAVAWLRGNGRRAECCPVWTYDAQPDPVALGHLWRATPWLLEVLPSLTPGTALELACGSGRDTVYLAAQGWQVTAVDVLPDALARARDLARRYAAALRPIAWLEADLERGLPVFERRFDLVVGFRYLHRPLLSRLGDWIVTGGSLIYETFTTRHRARYGRPARAAHILEPGELRHLLSGWELVHYSEDWRGAAHTARVWARLPAHPSQ